jgi:hypothetical protein
MKNSGTFDSAGAERRIGVQVDRHPVLRLEVSGGSKTR